MGRQVAAPETPLNFLIWSWPFSTNTGGGVALHKLAHDLACLGHDAALSCDRTATGWKGRPIGWKTWSVLGSDVIVVYPEIVQGEPVPRQARGAVDSQHAWVFRQRKRRWPI